MRLLPVLGVLCSLGCGGAPGAKSTLPASTGVAAYIEVLRSDDPRGAYALLSDEVKRQLAFEEFAAQWKETASERQDQARALAAGLKGDPELGERAKVVYPDGKTVHMVREGGSWHLESALVSRLHASRPRDAIESFAGAMARRDYEGVLRVLTSRRREGIGAQVESFVTSLSRRLADTSDAIEMIGNDRAELRWDDDGRHYRIVLRKEGDEWRVDDVHIRPIPAGADDDR